MSKENSEDNITKQDTTREKGKEKILLVLPPFWTALIPPMGLSCLKSFLQDRGYPVTTVDTNIEVPFKELYKSYFNTLKNTVPEDKRGNFFNIGKDVLQNHLMACLNRTSGNETPYARLVETLVEKTFFCPVDPGTVSRLNRIADEFYSVLRDYFTPLLDREKPAVLGLSVYEGTLPAALFVAKLTKELRPQTRVVMGGGIFAEQLSTGSPDWDYFLEKTPFIDNIIMGEGENLFLNLLENRFPGSRRVFTLKDIQGETLDLASVPLPDFSDFPLESYPYMAAYGSRSCTFQCKFCSETVQWGKFRKKSGGQLAGELTQLSRQYNRQLFLMCDSLLNPVASDLSKGLVETGQSVYWDGYLRAGRDVCLKENVLLWRRGGLYRTRLGVESGSPRTLERMNKKITVEQIEGSVSNLAFYGIKTTTYWIIGYPGETEEDFQLTLDLVERLKNDIYEAWCSPFYYFPTGQVNSDGWKAESGLLYPEETREMLLLRTWVRHGEPSREETYRRLNRFIDHCRRLGVPNPFFMHDFYRADARWKKLHANAVPSLVEFENNNTRIDENKHIEEVFIAKNKHRDEGDFNI